MHPSLAPATMTRTVATPAPTPPTMMMEGGLLSVPKVSQVPSSARPTLPPRRHHLLQLSQLRMLPPPPQRALFTLFDSFTTNGKTISINIPLSSSSISMNQSSTTLREANHHKPYLSFENAKYEFSCANESEGTMSFLCARAFHPDPKEDGKWISTRTWHRLKKPAGTPTLKECRCKAKLFVWVNKSANRDVAIILHPHECGKRKIFAATTAIPQHRTTSRSTTAAHDDVDRKRKLSRLRLIVE